MKSQSFIPLSQLEFDDIIKWLEDQELKQCDLHEEGSFVAFVPNFELPSFRPVSLLTDSQRDLVYRFMQIATSAMHQRRQFIHCSRTRMFMDYNRRLAFNLSRFKNLSTRKVNQSVYHISTNMSERFEAEEQHPIESLVSATAFNRKSKLGNQDFNRPRFRSETFNKMSEGKNPSSQRRGKAILKPIEKQTCPPDHPVHSCGICNRRIEGLKWICQKCNHGGHINHLRDWFRSNTYCPTCFECACKSTV